MKLRIAICHWRLTAAAVLLLAVDSTAQTTRPSVSAVVRVGMTVDDLDRSVDFFTRLLDFRKISETEVAGDQFEHLTGVFGARARVVDLQLGSETIELTEYLTPRGRVIPRESRSNDRWFQHIAIVTADMDKAYARLGAAKVRYASTGPQRLPDWNPNAGGIKAFYFKDPDDHVLEVIWFPHGKGDPRWQGRSELFPGIDHTAIVVGNTETSLKFYRDQLGMRVAGESDNYGTEQEHLNNVFGAHLRITGLRAPGGPGVEFLEYLAPRDGKPYPADARPNDLFHWQTSFSTADAAGLFKDLRSVGYTVISSNPISEQGTPRFLARSPDGHAVQIVSQPGLAGASR
jgi:catechol 2,3-dioxygenase-like lactoylglutathione lyase family enzyme